MPMQSISTIQFISQVKLGELRRQRLLLVEEYDWLLQECQAGSPTDGLRTLYDGLRRIKVAGKPLHPDLPDVDFLLAGIAPSAETVAFWRQSLDSELAKGRLRADIVYLFGALLGEWGSDGPSKQIFLEERQQALVSLLQFATKPAQEKPLAILEEVFASFGDQLQSLPSKIAEAARKALERGENSVMNLSGISRDIYLPPAVRAEARRFLNDQVLQMQFADVLRVVTADPRQWAWPEPGVSARALWTRNKWRLYLNLSLIELNTLNSFGWFWPKLIEENFTDSARKIHRLARYRKLVDLKSPQVILENERRMFSAQLGRIDLGWYEALDPWDGSAPVPGEEPIKGIVAQRAAQQGALRETSSLGSGYYQGYSSNMIGLVHAEVRTLRAAFPDVPLFVLKLDLRDYFATIPHRVLLEMMSRFGLSNDDLGQIEHFLAVPYSIDGDIVHARRGVPNNHFLSHWLAEWLLRLMERYVHRHAAVRIIRQVDDVCILSPRAADAVSAWRAVHRFVEGCGLEINTDKCGALALGAELPAELPAARPRWGMLELVENGEWGVQEPTFRTFCDETRHQVASKHAVLAKVTLYNAHLQFLTASLALSLDLGDVHRDAVNSAIRRFDLEFFGSQTGIVAGLRGCIGERYLEATQLIHLPESWMYWPITAGGLSLRSSLVICGQYQQAFAARQKNRVTAPTNRSANWQTGDEKWTAYYDDQSKKLQPAKPRESKVMKSLVDDFIARGQEISGGKQQGLSDYWRWVLCLHGPDILNRFGTFRFLLTDLVPLQLIHEQLLHDSSLEH